MKKKKTGETPENLDNGDVHRREPGRCDADQPPATVHANKKIVYLLEEEQKDKEIAQRPRHHAEKKARRAAAERRSTGMRAST